MESDVGALIKAVHGKLLFGDGMKQFNGVSIDSRTLKPGQLFVCLRGDRFDGHDFLKQAIERKPAGILVSRREGLPLDDMRKEKVSAVGVPDTLRGLQDLAAFHRNRFPVRIVGVTGTNGKSTTKEMIANITQTRFRTLKTMGNLNNHIGLPLSLLNLEKDHEVAVMEMGMSDRGEIARLAEIAKPEIGVITNISEAHMIHLKTLKDVQSAKGELFDALPKGGTAVVNADDPLVLALAKNLRTEVITFGMDNSAEVTAQNIREQGESGFEFEAKVFGEIAKINLPFAGQFNISNALAAIATATALGLPEEVMNEGLSQMHGLSQRGERLEHQGMTLWNDTYNANPRSMLEAARTLQGLPCSGNKFLVIGDMLELGEQEKAAHTQLGKDIAELGMDYLVAVGPLTRLTGEAAIQNGMDAARVFATTTHDEAVEFLKEHARPGDSLLFKGSRGSKMELILERLMQRQS